MSKNLFTHIDENYDVKYEPIKIDDKSQSKRMDNSLLPKLIEKQNHFFTNHGYGME